MRRSLEIDARAVALYAAGFGLAEVGRFVGLSVGTVFAILRERNIPRRSRGRRWPPKMSGKKRDKKMLPLAS